jgi:hypothetical protein
MDVRADTMTKAMHFELWGYPGAGKSTIARSLRDEWGMCVPRVRSCRMSFVSHSIKSGFLLASPTIFTGLLLYLSDRKRERISLAKLAIRQAATFADYRDPVLIEEGVAHELWRVLYSDPTLIKKTWWRQFARYAGPTIIVLEVTPERARNGIREKVHPGPINRELTDASLDSERWRNAKAAFTAVLEALEFYHKGSVVRLNITNASIREACAKIMEYANRVA